ncbi:hypothetical protein G3N57_18120 [Paraburkholderia sp. Se-20369]|nr:hypothetical protein [Paraburkholderia sp. Se-20369]
MRRIAAARGAIAACHSGKTPRFIRMSCRFPVNSAVIACRAVAPARDARGACAACVFITFCVFAHSSAQFPNILTIAPVNPHLCRIGRVTVVDVLHAVA